jgi:type I restriction enzyme S subunit
MSDYFVKKAEHSSTGSVFAGIRISTLNDMDIVIPPKVIIDKFTNKLTNIYKLKYGKSKENQELTSLRDFLLPMLMNGQVTFK